MSRTSLFVLLLAFSVAISCADIWTNCGTGSDDLQLTGVVVTPNPPVKGKDVNITITGTLKKDVTSGSVQLTVKFGVITLINKAFDLCDEAGQTSTPCPIKANANYWNTLIESIPSSAPGGTYSGKIVGTDQDKNEIACATIAFKL